MATVTEIERQVSTTGATVTATVGDITPLTSGHIIVVCSLNDNETLTAGDLTDTDSLTWQLDHANISTSNSIYVFSAEIESGSVDDGHQFTVDNNGVSTNRKGLLVYHVDGLASGTWLDEIGDANENTDTSVDATLDASTTEDDTLVFLAGSAVGDGSVAWTPDGDDGDVLDISTNRVMFTSWHEETSAGTHTEGGDKDHTGNWRAVILAYILDVGGTAYELSADPASYAVTGVAATVPADRVVIGSPGSYAVTGSVASPVADRMVTAAPGAYTLSGLDTTLERDRVLVADPGSYAFTGTAAPLIADRMIEAAFGTYAFTGTSADLVPERMLSASPGAFTLSGLDAALIGDRTITAEPAVYAVSGAAATLLAERALAADPGAYAVSGAVASLIADRILALEPGAYVITGVAADLVPPTGSYSLDAEPASYAVSGVTATLVAARIMEAAPGAYVVSGLAASTVVDRILEASPGAYVLTGTNAALIGDRVLAVEPGSYTIVGVDALTLGPGGESVLFIAFDRPAPVSQNTAPHAATFDTPTDASRIHSAPSAPGFDKPRTGR